MKKLQYLIADSEHHLTLYEIFYNFKCVYSQLGKHQIEKQMRP